MAYTSVCVCVFLCVSAFAYVCLCVCTLCRSCTVRLLLSVDRREDAEAALETVSAVQPHLTALD